MSPEEYRRLEPLTETEEEWKDCEIPIEYQNLHLEERKAEEDPKTLVMSADIMSQPKLSNAEETAYIGGEKSNEENPTPAVVEDTEEVSLIINITLKLKNKVVGATSPPVGTAGKHDQVEMQFDEITTNLTTKVSNNLLQTKVNKLGTNNQGANQVSEGGASSSDSKIDLEAAKKFNSDLMSSLIARKMSKNKTFYEIKVQAQAQLNHGAMGHLHGIGGAGLTSNMPAGHFTTQPGARPHLSTAQNLPNAAGGKQRQTHQLPPNSGRMQSTSQLAFI